ncbi:MAG: metallophosphoesterase [Ignavibacteriaceae bacterium]
MIAVIGDIHGCYLTLKNLVEKIRSEYPGILIYSVGDLVDRGNFSFEVVNFIISEKIVFTAGNHDLMFYNFIKRPTSEMGITWLYNGYEKTVASYDNHFENLSLHLDFIINAPLFLYLENCFISHAGISKYYKKKLPENLGENLNSLESILRNDLENPHGIIWTRDELLNLGMLQVVGHTRMNDVTFKKENNVAYIDTSVYTGDKLSAVIIDDGKIFNTIFVPTNPKDIE